MFIQADNLGVNRVKKRFLIQAIKVEKTQLLSTEITESGTNAG